MGEYSFMKLIKLKKMGEFTLSFTSPEKDFFLYIYDVIVKPKKNALYIPTPRCGRMRKIKLARSLI